jgi:hypothetical protein
LANATLKGRVFLDLCGQLQQQTSTGRLNAEMLHILRLFEMRYAPSAIKMSAESLHLAGPMLTEIPEMVTARLLATIAAATERWGIELEAIDHVRHDDDDRFEKWAAEDPSCRDCAKRAISIHSEPVHSCCAKP